MCLRTEVPVSLHFAMVSSLRCKPITMCRVNLIEIRRLWPSLPWFSPTQLAWHK